MINIEVPTPNFSDPAKKRPYKSKMHIRKPDGQTMILETSKLNTVERKRIGTIDGSSIKMLDGTIIDTIDDFQFIVKLAENARTAEFSGIN